MEVRYQDIRINREYIITGRQDSPYQNYPRMVVRVLEQPPPFQLASLPSRSILGLPEGNFYPSFQVRILRILDVPNPPLDSHFHMFGHREAGQTFTVNWRSNSWGHQWSDMGPNWEFRNAVLEPLASDLQAKSQALSELKAIPSSPPQHPGFPGGTDFLSLAASHQLRAASFIRAPSLEGGITLYKPVY